MLQLGIRRLSYGVAQLPQSHATRLPTPPTSLPFAKYDKVVGTADSFAPAIKEVNSNGEERLDGFEGTSKEYQDPEETTSTKRQYVLADHFATITSEGCAPLKKICRSLSTYLQKQSSMKSSLSACSVSLFNFHNTEFAENLLRNNIGSLVLVESAYANSKIVKDFVKSKKRDSRQVEAFHADLSALLGIGRKKLSRFPAHLLGNRVQRNPLTLFTQESEDESGCKFSNSPILISALPLPSYQQQVISSLQNNLLLHHNACEYDTLFQYGAVELLTFFDLRTLARLLCAVEPSLSFYSHSIRRQSELFNMLFEIRCLSDEGFDRKSFAPPIPKSEKKTITHEKKLVDLGWNPSLLYAVSIKPKTHILFSERSVNGGADSVTSNVFMPFSFWLQIVGRQPHAKKTSAVLRSLVPESADSALGEVDGDLKIGMLSGPDMERVFLKSREEIVHNPLFVKYATSVSIKRNI